MSPKPFIKSEFGAGEIINTLLAGHHYWRPDLEYPKSHSDMQGAVEGLLLKYEVKLRPLPLDRNDLYE